MPYSNADIGNIKAKFGYSTHEAHIFKSAFNAVASGGGSEEKAFKVAHSAVNRQQKSKQKKQATRAYELPATEVNAQGKLEQHPDEYAAPLHEGELPTSEFSPMGGNLPFGRFDIQKYRQYNGYTFYETEVRPWGEDASQKMGLMMIHDSSQAHMAHNHADSCQYPCLVTDGSRSEMHLGKQHA